MTLQGVLAALVVAGALALALRALWRALRHPACAPGCGHCAATDCPVKRLKTIAEAPRSKNDVQSGRSWASDLTGDSSASSPDSTALKR